MMLTLYFAPGSSSMAPHICLHEIGAPFEPRLTQFGTGALRSAEFLALNPEGKVPLLLADGRRLTEVAGILFYLARRYPEAGLWPTNLQAEACAVSWMSYLASTVHPARAGGAEHAHAVWSITDRRLAESGTWAVETGYSVADIHLFRLFWRFRRANQPPAGAYPALESHHDRMMDREAVQRTIAIEQAIGYRLP